MITSHFVLLVSSVKWQKNGVFIQSSNRLMAHNGPDGMFNLTLRTPTITDSGTYTCVALNTNPPISTACNLAILPAGGKQSTGFANSYGADL